MILLHIFQISIKCRFMTLIVLITIEYGKFSYKGNENAKIPIRGYDSNTKDPRYKSGTIIFLAVRLDEP